MDIGDGTDALNGIKTGGLAGRRDGRSAGEMRGLIATQDIVKQADGSARISMGKTEVLAAVYGPMECPVGKQKVGKAMLTVVVKIPGDFGKAEFEKDVSAIVEESVFLQANPRKALAVIVHVLSDEGGALAVAVNAVSLALLDSGVPLRCCVVASSLTITDGEILVDPDAPEESDADTACVFAFDVTSSSTDGFLLARVSGNVGGEHTFHRAHTTALDAALKTYGFLKSAVDRRIQTEFKNLYQYLNKKQQS